MQDEALDCGGVFLFLSCFCHARNI